MCRFLLVQSKEKIQPKAMLLQFAEMAKNSHALDGDWQGDGWGYAWLGENNTWQVYKSLKPIWKEIDTFTTFQPVHLFISHARSASFSQHKGVIEFNQPYINGEYAFVFNGLLKGVSLSNVPGKIGAEKIWYLLRQELQKYSPQEALEKTKELLIRSSREIVALNIGLATSKDIYSLNFFTHHPEYYSLHTYEEDSIKILCSEELDWTVVRQ